MRTTPDQFMASLDLPVVYRVGGSVRDELLGRTAKDSDYVVCGASLETLMATLSGPAKDLGVLRLRNGQRIGVRARIPGIGSLEIVLPRTEESTGSGHGHFRFLIDPDLPLAADAIRRDFTMNALYRDVSTGYIIDPLDQGIYDVKHGVIRTTHTNSFRDDPLRILRALRFASKLGFWLSNDTADQMVRHADAVTGLTQKGVSGTALTELEGLLMGDQPAHALTEMATTGVMSAFLPELDPMIDFEQRSFYHTKTTSEHTFDAVQAAAFLHGMAPLRVRMALLFHDAGKPKMAWTDKDGLQHYYALTPEMAINLGASVNSLRSHEDWSAELASSALHRLNAPKRLREDVVTLVARHMLPLHENIRPFKVRTWRAELGDELFRDLITHRFCDVLGKGGDTQEAVEVLSWIEAERQRAVEAGVPLSVKDLKITGHEIKNLGAEGRQIGEIQRKLLHDVLAQPKLNTEDWLIQAIVRLIREKNA